MTKHLTLLVIATLCAIALSAVVGVSLANATAGDIYNLGTLGGTSSGGYDINDAGQAVGSANGCHRTLARIPLGQQSRHDGSGDSDRLHPGAGHRHQRLRLRGRAVRTTAKPGSLTPLPGLLMSRTAQRAR